MNTNDPRIHWKTSLTMGAVMIAIVLAVSLPLAALTDWPSWIAPAVAGGIGGLTAPHITRWIMTRRKRDQDTPSEDTDQ